MKINPAIQKRLNILGFNAGNPDGDLGPKTQKAIDDFLLFYDLRADGDLNWYDLAVLFTAKPATKPKQLNNIDLPWLAEIDAVLGWHEVRDNRKLADWLASDGVVYAEDPATYAYCAEGIQTAIARCLPHEPIPKGYPASRNWVNFGIEVPPQDGAILALHNGDPKDWRGHLTVCIGQSENHFLCQGFNQSNMVSKAWFPKSRLRAHGSRWPVTAKPPKGKVTKYVYDGGAIPGTR